jgi:radical SAM protein with 4Fe4S-binding SPASM domain
MDTGLFNRIAESLFSRVLRVSFCSGGEPYLHPALIDILETVKRYHVPVWLLSNGTLADNKFTEPIIDRCLVDSHGFSLDGFRSDTISSIRRKINPDTVIKNILGFLKARELSGSTKPGVVIRYSIMKRNLHELPDAVRFWADHGVDRIDCNYVTVCREAKESDSVFDIPSEVEKVFDNVRRLTGNSSRTKVVLPASTLESKPISSCCFPWSFAMIDTDGSVYPCYHGWPVLAMGQFCSGLPVNFRKMWNSKSWKHLRDICNRDATGEDKHYCERCTVRKGVSDFRSHILEPDTDRWPAQLMP